MDNNLESQSLLHQPEPRSNRKLDIVKKAAFAVGTLCLFGGGIVAAHELLKRKDGGNDLQIINEQGEALPFLQTNGENSGFQEFENYHANDTRLAQGENSLASWFEKCLGDGQQVREHSRDFRHVYDGKKIAKCFSPLLSNEEAMGNIKPVLEELIRCYRPLLNSEQQIMCVGSRLNRKTVESLSQLFSNQEVTQHILQVSRSCDQETMDKFVCVFNDEKKIGHLNRQLQELNKAYQEGSAQHGGFGWDFALWIGAGVTGTLAVLCCGFGCLVGCDSTSGDNLAGNCCMIGVECCRLSMSCCELAMACADSGYSEF